MKAVKLWALLAKATRIEILDWGKDTFHKVEGSILLIGNSTLYGGRAEFQVDIRQTVLYGGGEALVPVTYVGIPQPAQQPREHIIRFFEETPLNLDNALNPITPDHQYELAIRVPCPVCKVEVGKRCHDGGDEPRHPHTHRIKAALVEAGMDPEEVETFWKEPPLKSLLGGDPDEKVTLNIFEADGLGRFWGDGAEISINDIKTIGEFIQTNVETEYELRVVAVKDDSTLLRIVQQRLVFPIPAGGSQNNKWDPKGKVFRTIID